MEAAGSNPDKVNENRTLDSNSIRVTIDGQNGSSCLSGFCPNL